LVEQQGIELLTFQPCWCRRDFDNQLFSNTFFGPKTAPLDWTLRPFGAVLSVTGAAKAALSAPESCIRGFGWCKAAHPAQPDTGDHPMKTTSTPRPQTAKHPRNPSNASTAPVPADLPRPGGKLGDILGRVASKNGATADELVDATGWQKHSVLGALSKLKARGFEIRLDAKANRKAYRLVSTVG